MYGIRALESCRARQHNVRFHSASTGAELASDRPPARPRADAKVARAAMPDRPPGPRVPPDGSVHLLSIDALPLEEAVSRRALRRRARLAIEELPADADVLDVAMLARAGDSRARRVFDDAFAALGSALAPWHARFEASVLVVGGSMTGSWDLVRPPLVGALRRAEPALAGLAVRRAAHPEDSALIGAAVHAWAVDQDTAAGS
jgi:glucokinase